MFLDGIELLFLGSSLSEVRTFSTRGYPPARSGLGKPLDLIGLSVNYIDNFEKSVDVGAVAIDLCTYSEEKLVLYRENWDLDTGSEKLAIDCRGGFGVFAKTLG